MLGPMMMFLNDTKKRPIIFCGHSLGGAVCQVALLWFLATLHSDVTKDSQTSLDDIYPADKLYSISFGAPFFGDEAIAKKINSCYRDRFINIVHQDDPVPRLLYDLPATAASVGGELLVRMKAATEVLTNVNSFIVDSGGFVAKVMDGYAEGGGRGGLAAAKDAAVAQGMKVAGAMSATVALQYEKQWSEACKALKDSKQLEMYLACGDFHFLESPNFGEQGALVRHTHITADCQFIHDKFRQVKLSAAAIFDHKLSSYTESVHALIANRSRGRAHMASPTDTAGSGTRKARVTSPAPAIKSAIVKSVDAGREYELHVYGTNLLFLVDWCVETSPLKESSSKTQTKPVVAWKVRVQTDNQLKLATPGGSFADEEDVKSLELYTMFGKAEEIVQTLATEPRRGIRRQLQHIVQSNATLAEKIGTKINPKLGEWLDNVLSVANGATKETFTTIMSALAKKRSYDKDLHSMLNSFLDEVDEALARKSLPIFVKKSTLKSHLGAVFLFGVPITGVLLQSWLTWTDVDDVGSQWGAVFRRSEKNLGKLKRCVRIDEMVTYDQVLACLAKEFVGEEDKSWDSLPRDEKESRILRSVESYNFIGSSIPELDKSVPPFKSEQLACAVPETRKEILKRIKIMSIIDKIYKENQDVRFLGILGERNAGKSFFVQGLSGKTVLNMGNSKKTTIVEPYKMESAKSDIWLVDFPGLNDWQTNIGLEWRKYTGFPNMVLYLLEFKMEIPTHPQVKYYREIVREFETEVWIVFNKVDKVLCDEEGEQVTPEFLEKCRKEAAEAFECPTSRILFSSFNPRLKMIEAAERTDSWASLASQVLTLEQVKVALENDGTIQSLTSSIAASDAE